MPGEFSLSLYIYVVDETKVYCELVRKQTALSIGSDYCAPTRSSLLCILKSFFKKSFFKMFKKFFKKSFLKSFFKKK